MTHSIILLATDDSAAAVKPVGLSADCELHCVQTSREAVTMGMDGRGNQDLVVVDFDLRDGGRTLLRTAGGALPAVAISTKAKPWLASLGRRQRIGATLTKPVSPEKLRDAFRRVQGNSFIEAQRGRLRLG